MLNKPISHLNHCPFRRLLGYMSAFFLLAHLFYFIQGVRFIDAPLYVFWQYLSSDLLQQKLLESLWYLHSQPPLYNAFLGIVLKFSAGHARIVFQGIYLILGYLLYLLVFALCIRLGVSRAKAFVLSTVFLFSPSFILYEQYLTYTFPLAFLLVFSAVMLAEWLNTRRAGFLWGLYFSLFLLGGTHTMLALPFFLLMAVFPIIATRGRRKRTVQIGLIFFGLLLSIYVKNLIVFGKFAVSSWAGMNLSATTTDQIPFEERQNLVDRKRLSPLALIPRFSDLENYPPALANPVKYPHIETLHSPNKWNGAVNFNHLAYIGISDRYYKDAVFSAIHYPQYFALGLRSSWNLYFKSTSSNGDYLQNREKIRVAEVLYNNAFYGQLPIRHFVRFFPALRGISKEPYYIFLLAGLPLVVIYGLLITYGNKHRFDRGRKSIVLYLCTSILYVAVIGNTFELGENNRFRFMTDPLSLVLLGVWLQYGVVPWGRKRLERIKMRPRSQSRKNSPPFPLSGLFSTRAGSRWRCRPRGPAVSEALNAPALGTATMIEHPKIDNPGEFT